MDKTEAIVKYHNDLNEIMFQRFGQIDFDFFMGICSRLRDSEEDETVIGFDEFKKLIGYNSTKSEKRFISELQSMNRKQLLSTGMIKTGNRIEQFVLFTRFVIDPDVKTITVEVNRRYKYILNEVTKNFTRFELAEFVGLSSKYGKSLYRLLKQFRTTGLYKVGIEDFKKIMDIPKSYTNMKIGQKILKPSVEMLRPYFKNLDYKVLYERKHGHPVKGYEFTFDPETVPQISTAPETDARIDAGWQKHKEYRKNHPVNNFHNFEQRDYDYDDLERRLLERNN